MGDVVLNANPGRDALLRVLAGRQLSPTDLQGKPGRKIIRVQIGGDDSRPGVVEFFKIGDDPSESVMRLFRLQITDMLADKNLRADGQGDGVFQVRADGENNFGVRSSEFRMIGKGA